MHSKVSWRVEEISLSESKLGDKTKASRTSENAIGMIMN